MLLSHKIYPNTVWRAEPPAPFDELILSWNAPRPREGSHQFMVRLKTSCWSAWMAYAQWGAASQSTFEGLCESSNVKVYQDTVEVVNGGLATAFEITVNALGGAPSDAPIDLHVCVTDKKSLLPSAAADFQSSVSLPVAGLSQIALKHPASMRICSPTATAAALGFLKQAPVDAVSFAARTYDQRWDIYGNWALNVAEAYTELAEPWQCWVQRLPHFEAILSHLHAGTPVVVSVRGPLEGSAQPYLSGHLMVVCGYDAALRQVICMDPAFPTDGQTAVRYALDNFLAAWYRRLNVAYLFQKKVNFV